MLVIKWPLIMPERAWWRMCWGCPVSDGQECRQFVARALLEGMHCLPVGCWGTKPCLPYQQPWRIQSHQDLQSADVSSAWEVHWKSAFSPDFFLYPLAAHWVSSLHIRMAVLSQPDGPIGPFPQGILLAVSKLIWILLGALLFKFFR